MFTSALLGSFLGAAIVGLLWTIKSIHSERQKEHARKTHQYVVTITGEYEKEFIQLLKNIVGTHVQYYNDNISLSEITEPIISTPLETKGEPTQ